MVIYCPHCAKRTDYYTAEPPIMCGYCGKKYLEAFAKTPMTQSTPVMKPKQVIVDDDDDDEMPTELPEVGEIGLAVEKAEKRLSFEKIGDIVGTQKQPVPPRKKYTKKDLKAEFKNLSKPRR
jgi:DNA-directed RNA polymerase subunit RPC12/RpoP